MEEDLMLARLMGDSADASSIGTIDSDNMSFGEDCERSSNDCINGDATDGDAAPATIIHLQDTEFQSSSVARMRRPSTNDGHPTGSSFEDDITTSFHERDEHGTLLLAGQGSTTDSFAAVAPPSAPAPAPAAGQGSDRNHDRYMECSIRGDDSDVESCFGEDEHGLIDPPASIEISEAMEMLSSMHMIPPKHDGEPPSASAAIPFAASYGIKQEHPYQQQGTRQPHASAGNRSNPGPISFHDALAPCDRAANLNRQQRGRRLGWNVDFCSNDDTPRSSRSNPRLQVSAYAVRSLGHGHNGHGHGHGHGHGYDADLSSETTQSFVASSAQEATLEPTPFFRPRQRSFSADGHRMVLLSKESSCSPWCDEDDAMSSSLPGGTVDGETGGLYQTSPIMSGKGPNRRTKPMAKNRPRRMAVRRVKSADQPSQDHKSLLRTRAASPSELVALNDFLSRSEHRKSTPRVPRRNIARSKSAEGLRRLHTSNISLGAGGSYHGGRPARASGLLLGLSSSPSPAARSFTREAPCHDDLTASMTSFSTNYDDNSNCQSNGNNSNQQTTTTINNNTNSQRNSSGSSNMITNNNSPATFEFSGVNLSKVSAKKLALLANSKPLPATEKPTSVRRRIKAHDGA